MLSLDGQRAVDTSYELGRNSADVRRSTPSGAERKKPKGNGPQSREGGATDPWGEDGRESILRSGVRCLDGLRDIELHADDV